MGLSKSSGVKPRLLIILNRFVIGGQAVDTIPLAFALKDDFDILLLYGEKQKDEVEAGYLLTRYPGLRLKKISHLRRSINPLIDVVAFLRLYFAIVRFKADIVHTHGAKSGFLGRIAAYFAGVPVIVHSFHGHFFHSYFSSRISKLVAGVERTVGKLTTAAIALSDSQKHDLSTVYKILPPEKLTVIPLGFEYQQHAPAEELRSSFRRTYNIRDTDIAVGIVGRIVPVKNHSFFVDVIQEYTRRYTADNICFFIVGDGELRRDLEQQLDDRAIPYSDKNINANNLVVFTSWLQEMDKVMNGLDIVVLTSLNEGTPLSLIEAQYFKRPVVCTDVGGVTDTMRGGSTGFLVEQGDSTTFCESIRRLSLDAGLRRIMGEAGHEFISKTFSKQNEVRITKDFYFSLLHLKTKLHA